MDEKFKPEKNYNMIPTLIKFKSKFDFEFFLIEKKHLYFRLF